MGLGRRNHTKNDVRITGGENDKRKAGMTKPNPYRLPVIYCCLLWLLCDIMLLLIQVALPIV